MILIFIETLTFQKTFVALSICSVAERDDIESARRRSLKGRHPNWPDSESQWYCVSEVHLPFLPALAISTKIVDY